MPSDSCFKVLVAMLLSMCVAGSFAKKGPEGDGHVVVEESGTGPMNVAFNQDRVVRAGYLPGEKDSVVWALQMRVKEIRLRWIDVSTDDVAARKSIIDSALFYSAALAQLPDESLGIGGLIVRDEYACYGFVIAAANSATPADRARLGKRAERFCTSAERFLQVAYRDAGSETNAQAVVKWANGSDEQPRIIYLSAMSLCLQSGGAAGDSYRLAAKRALRFVPQYYLNQYPPAEDDVLRRCL
jgi:hypothetical protein